MSIEAIRRDREIVSRNYRVYSADSLETRGKKKKNCWHGMKQ